MSSTRKNIPARNAITAVVGSDESAIKRAAQTLACELTPGEGGDFACDTIDGDVDSADQAAARIHDTINALLTLPFFGGGKLVWLKNVSFLGDDPMGRSETVGTALENLRAVLAKGLPDGVRLLISAIGVDKRRSFYKTLASLATVVVHDRPDISKAGWEAAAAEMVLDEARTRGLRFEEDALDLFIQCTGVESGQIVHELEKLDLYLGAGRRTVAREDVRLLVPRTKAGVLWELGNALARRDVPECLGLIDQLLLQGETGVGILLATVIPTVRNLLLVKDLMVRHRLRAPEKPFFFKTILDRLPAVATEHLPRKKDGTINAYPLGIAACGARLFTLSELVSLYEECVKANVRLVTTSMPPRVVLGKLVARLAIRPLPNKAQRG